MICSSRNIVAQHDVLIYSRCSVHSICNKVSMWVTLCSSVLYFLSMNTKFFLTMVFLFRISTIRRSSKDIWYKCWVGRRGELYSSIASVPAFSAFCVKNEHAKFSVMSTGNKFGMKYSSKISESTRNKAAKMLSQIYRTCIEARKIKSRQRTRFVLSEQRH